MFCLISPLPATADVLLATAIFPPSYAPDTFGRRLTFQTGYATGEDDGPLCSDTAVDNVVLVLDLPPDTTLVSESLGSGVYDAGAGTVTWQVGTVQPCVIQLIDVTFDVDPVVPDGTSVDVTVLVTTTTPGDDPSDNQPMASFVIGFQPLEVSLTSSEANCERDSGTTTIPNLIRISCNTFKHTNHGGSQVPGVILGYIANGPIPDVVRTIPALASASNFLTTDDVSTTVEALIAVSNPNPYEVRLHAHRDTHTSCWVDDGTTEAYIETNGQSQFAECGFGNIDQMVEYSFSEFDAEGEPGGDCSVTVLGNSTERGSLDSSGSIPSCLSQSVGANGQRLFRLDSFAGSATQRGHGAVVTRWSIGLAGSPADANVVFMEIGGGSPVLLRLRDADGFEVGAVDEGAGPVSRIDLPGSFYNGVAADPQQIQVALPFAGAFTLEVLGTGVGPYAITLQAFTHGQALTGELMLAGEASDGSLDAFVFTLHQNGTLELGASIPSLGLPLLLALALALAGAAHLKLRRSRP
jgi:hypothetical protein